jgi:hypothetical protein
LVDHHCRSDPDVQHKLLNRLLPRFSELTGGERTLLWSF